MDPMFPAGLPFPVPEILEFKSAKVKRRRREGDGKKTSRQFTTRHDNFRHFFDTSRQFPTIFRHFCLFAHVTEFVIKRHKSVIKCHDNFRHFCDHLRQSTTKYDRILAVPFLASPFDLRRLKHFAIQAKFSSNFPGIFPELSSSTPAKTPETATALSSFLKIGMLLSISGCDLDGREMVPNF